MEGIKYTPIGKTRLTPRQQMERHIRQLERAVAVVGVMCIGMAAAICVMLMG